MPSAVTKTAMALMPRKMLSDDACEPRCRVGGLLVGHATLLVDQFAHRLNGPEQARRT